MRPIYRFFLSLCLLATAVASAQPTQRPVIHLKAGDVDVAAARGSNWRQALTTIIAPRQVLLHFASLPTQAEREAMQRQGITLLEYVPDNAYTAIVAPGAVLTSNNTDAAIGMQAEWKADKYLWNKTIGEKGALTLLVSCYGNGYGDALRELAGQLGGQVAHSGKEANGIYKVTVAATQLKELAEWYAVRYVSLATDPVPLDLQSRPAVKGNIAVAAGANGGYGLDGAGVTVGVGDNSSGVAHIDLKDRIENFNPGPGQAHGTHVNGIVGSASIVDPLAASMAPRVNLVDFMYDGVLAATGAMYNDHNMTITNNSYSVMAANCDYSGTYDVVSNFVDSLALRYPEVLHVFASGNDGWMECAPYPKGYGTVAGGYQPAKNNLVVGSMTDLLEAADDESKGPMRDGRLKPEIVAVGLGAYSTIPDDQYEWAAGTSMASPQVAGGMALLTQRYKQVNGNTQPRADLLKAIALAGALDLGTPGPDFMFGYGALDMHRSLKVVDNGWHKTGSTGNGSAQTMSITVPANTAQLKVMLVWQDVPASPAAAKQLVNDLDLVVTEPGGTRHLPLTLDPSPANMLKAAVEGEDHLNNSEEVVINNPAAGAYTVTIKGYSIPGGTQAFALAYDVVPKGVHLTYPLGGEALGNADTIRVFWDDVPDGHTYKVEFSGDDGAHWTLVGDNIPQTKHMVSFLPTGINSGTCRCRITKNGTGEVQTSDRFAVNGQPVVRLAGNQCPGYVHIHWTPIPNASGYRLLKKQGPGLVVTDTTTDTTYVYRGMPVNERSYVTVEPILSGLAGYRAIAVGVTANSGDCTGIPSAGDLAAETIVSPKGGRMYTSTQLTNATTVGVLLRNMYTMPVSNYTLWFRMNGGAWNHITNPGPIPAAGTAGINIPGFDMSAPGNYTVTVAVQNNDMADPLHANDTTTAVIRCLPNEPINLATPYTEGFEDMPKFSVTHDSMGISPNGHWDYRTDNDSGRIRSFVNSDITISGNRSVSMDEIMAVKQGSHNVLQGTFNLSNYDVATSEVRMDFDYIMHGNPASQDGNDVRARANDQRAWVVLHEFDVKAYPGVVTKVKSLSITDVGLFPGANLSASTQVAIGQNDLSVIAAANYGSGLTIDNVRLYTVTNDAELVKVVSPKPSNCGLPASVPLTVQVKNGVNYTLHNVQLHYKLNNGPEQTATIDSIHAKGILTFTFPQELAVAAGSEYKLDVWLTAPGDSYTDNDSIKGYVFRNNIVVTSFPYVEQFDTSAGHFFADGLNSSWQWGVPASPAIKRAPSGTKVWKTNLTGKYKNLEKSYLYSPCYDISLLQQPMLSFSIATDLEDCGRTLCDGAYVEYSYDGDTWKKLGNKGEGTNWYDSTFNLWNQQGMTRWHVASIPLPKSPTGQSIRLRFVMESDPAVTFEGVALDDIHIFDREHSILTPQYASATNSVMSFGAVDYLAKDSLIAIVYTRSTPNRLTVKLYPHDTMFNTSQTQYSFTRNYNVTYQNDVNDSALVQLFLTDDEVLRVVTDTNCPSCTPVEDAYTLGVSQYSGEARNGNLDDDTAGGFTFYPANRIQWLPYDNGYKAQLRTKGLSEFWFNNGGPTGTFSLGQDYLNFTALRTGNDVRTLWYAPIDTAVYTYSLQRSADGKDWTTILDTQAVHVPGAQYAKTDAGAMAANDTQYYRLQWQMRHDRSKTYTSPTRRVTASDTATGLITFDARLVGLQDVQLQWTSYLDGITDHYILERAVEEGAYSTLLERNAEQRYGQQYTYKDLARETPGTTIRYRLTAVLVDGTRVTLPEQKVTLVNNNEVVSIFPNPAPDGTFNIHWLAMKGSVMKIQLSTITGQQLFTGEVTAGQWENITQVHVTKPVSGVYFLWILINNKSYGRKVVF